jgi:hypothetical protein
MVGVQGNAVTEWDLSDAASVRKRDNARLWVGGLVVGAVDLGGFCLLVLELVIGPLWRDWTYYFATAALLVAGIGFVWVSLRAHAPGAIMIRADAEAMTVWYSSKSTTPRILRWDSPTFRFAMRRDADPKWDGDGLCLESSYRWPPSMLTDEAFFGVIAAARAAGMEVQERRTLWGYRTRVRIGPRRPADSTSPQSGGEPAQRVGQPAESETKQGGSAGGPGTLSRG